MRRSRGQVWVQGRLKCDSCKCFFFISSWEDPPPPSPSTKPCTHSSEPECDCWTQTWCACKVLRTRVIDSSQEWISRVNPRATKMLFAPCTRTPNVLHFGVACSEGTDQLTMSWICLCEDVSDVPCDCRQCFANRCFDPRCDAFSSQHVP